MIKFVCKENGTKRDLSKAELLPILFKLQYGGNYFNSDTKESVRLQVKEFSKNASL